MGSGEVMATAFAKLKLQLFAARNYVHVRCGDNG